MSISRSCPRSCRDKFDQYAVSGAVPVLVVDRVEVVQVEHQQNERVPEAIGPLALVEQPILEGPVAGDVGQGVDRKGVEGMSSVDRAPSPHGEGGRARCQGGSQQKHLAQRKGPLLQSGAKGEQGRQGEEKDRQPDLQNETDPAKMEIGAGPLDGHHARCRQQNGASQRQSQSDQTGKVDVLAPFSSGKTVRQ